MKFKSFSGKLFAFICFCSLYCSPEISYAADEPNISHDLWNELEIIPKKYDDLIDKLTHLKISLSRRQVTLYKGNAPIKSYAIAIGRPGWETPVGKYRVMDMMEKPTWIHPWTGEAIPGGNPENPLGNYWIGFWTNGKHWIGFHGTPNQESVGKAASHGCIRMYNKDVEELFTQVNLGTPVIVER